MTLTLPLRRVPQSAKVGRGARFLRLQSGVAPTEGLPGSRRTGCLAGPTIASNRLCRAAQIVSGRSLTLRTLASLTHWLASVFLCACVGPGRTAIDAWLGPRF